MKDDLKIFDLYEKTGNNRIEGFNNHLQSNFTIESSYEKVEADFEWLDLMETTTRYLDNILRNPNRFIINEEEIVQIEKAKRVTVESIKHLSKHTNFIQEIEKNGDVKPSKILNINKEESNNTYENRFIYTLILNMQSFIDYRKKKLILASSLKDVKKCEYNAVSRIGAEKVNINLVMDSKLLSEGDKPKGEESVEARLEKLELHIKDLMATDVYKSLARMHVAKVIPPIKKTNLILKNTNFQYAMALWDYMQKYVDDSKKNVKAKKVYQDDPELKGLLDDVFLLNYLVVNSVSINKDITKSREKEKAIEELTSNMINKIVELNSDLPMAKLQEIIGDRIAIIRKEKEASISEIQKVFDSHIRRYLNRIESYKF